MVRVFAIENGQLVGTCAFKTPPKNQQVEIAYFTFPGNEGRGGGNTNGPRALEDCSSREPINENNGSNSASNQRINYCTQ
jgi:hypothetical protein